MAKQESMPVRLSFEAIDAAKKAASLTGSTLADYASKVLLEAANRDMDRWSQARLKTKKTGKVGDGDVFVDPSDSVDEFTAPTKRKGAK